jgi:signal transduction histidine kinase
LRDDGKGCNLKEVKQNKHFGLHLIKERIIVLGGEYEFDSSPEIGFTLKVTIPNVF